MVFPLRRAAGRVRKNPTTASWGDTLFRLGTGSAGVVVLVILGLIVLVLMVNSWRSMQTFGLGFLANPLWDPNTNQFGALAFIYGTLVTSALALLLGVPISIGIAIFLVELAPASVRTPLTYVVELLAAIPSVVYGLWGIFVLVPVMANYVDPALQGALGFLPIFQGFIYGYGLLTGGVILAIMIIPTVASLSRDALLAVPQSQREAALSLGATRWESTRMAVLSYARSGIFGAIILGLGRAFGETIAVTMVIGNANEIPLSLFGPAQTLSSLIATQILEGLQGSLQLSAIIELALVLLLVTLVINIFARIMVWRVFGERTEAMG
ncbi:MAG TPA: phosphate ABC transporter permease subunit PstC [Thermoplasmata archaeon]|nr:phosphate ABC transporter permease subunit PstC [Thermoplasmata archaeon]